MYVLENNETLFPGFIHLIFFCLPVHSLLFNGLPCRKERNRAIVKQTKIGTVTKVTLGIIWETGWSTYGLSRAHRYLLGLSWTDFCHYPCCTHRVFRAPIRILLCQFEVWSLYPTRHPLCFPCTHTCLALSVWSLSPTRHPLCFTCIYTYLASSVWSLECVPHASISFGTKSGEDRKSKNSPIHIQERDRRKVLLTRLERGLEQVTTITKFTASCQEHMRNTSLCRRISVKH